MSERQLKKLGIGITTFNRLERLQQVLRGVSENTSQFYNLLVVDDGSSDGTSDWLRDARIPHIAAPNRGVAWNKNRAIAHLALLDKCSEILLLEDDTVPNKIAWEQIWTGAAKAYGHMNYCGPWIRPLMDGGEGTLSDPYISGVFSGQCVVFSRRAILEVGFMDTRFGRYGYEHVEHTQRLLKSGYGGNSILNKFYLVESDLTVFEGGVSRFEPELAAAEAIYQEVSKDRSIYRNPYRSKSELRSFAAELLSSRLYSVARKISSGKNFFRLFPAKVSSHLDQR